MDLSKLKKAELIEVIEKMRIMDDLFLELVKEHLKTSHYDDLFYTLFKQKNR